MDAHLVAVPGLGTLTARSLAGGDLEGLGGQADGALDAQVLALGALDDLGADLLEDVDLAGGQGDTDLVGLLSRASVSRLLRFWAVPSTSDQGDRLGGAPSSRGITYGGLAVVLLGLLVRHFEKLLEGVCPSRLERGETATFRQSDEGAIWRLTGCKRSVRSLRELFGGVFCAAVGLLCALACCGQPTVTRHGNWLSGFDVGLQHRGELARYVPLSSAGASLPWRDEARTSTHLM